MERNRINRIAGYRTMLGMTQREISEYLGITPQNYSNKERGYRYFNDEEKRKIKQLFSQHFENVTYDIFF